MHLLIWNNRGIGNNPSISRLRQLIQSHSISIVAIQEPMVDSSEIAAVSHRLGMQNDITNGSEVAKIWILWKDNLSLQGITVHDYMFTREL